MKHRILLPIVVFLFTGLIITTGCRRGAPIEDLYNHPFPAVQSTYTQVAVEDAIIRAGSDLGWKISPVAPGEMNGTTLVKSKHTVNVAILYNLESKTYSIRYKSSTNMGYNAEKRKIHRNYNKWVQRLDQAISNELAKIR